MTRKTEEITTLKVVWKCDLINHHNDHRRPKLTFRESEKLIIYLFKYASRRCEFERDLSSYAVLDYTRTVENLSAL